MGNICVCYKFPSPINVFNANKFPEMFSALNKEMLSQFKNNAFLVNIARGAVVNEDDLIDALKNGKLGGAVLDVFNTEPLSEESELWSLTNVIITPHNSFVSPKNSERLFEVVYNNLITYMKEV